MAAFVAAAQGLRPTRSPDVVTAATKAALFSLAQRVADLEEGISDLDAMITPLLEETAPELLGVYGVGVGIDTAAALLVAAGDTPNVSVLRRPGPICAGSHRSRPPRAR
jgi:transposase